MALNRPIRSTKLQRRRHVRDVEEGEAGVPHYQYAGLELAYLPLEAYLSDLLAEMPYL